MDKVEKVKVLSQLFDLINYYYEYRDQPADDHFNFLERVEKCCNSLDIDFEEFKKEFKMDTKYSSL
ncbi:hypothetical protein [Bacillus smithii]|jgi:hypothetical protein|uniref:hypothetical protein n=1 Tax=Bacillus smithii TaxID=1479 RepID=UPI003D2196D7